MSEAVGNGWEARQQDHKTAGRRDCETARPRNDGTTGRRDDETAEKPRRSQAFSGILRHSQSCEAVRGSARRLA